MDIEMSATDLNYSVRVYECNAEMQQIFDPDLQDKIPKAVYRICFKPNQIAAEAGISIKNLDSWVWTTYNGQEEVAQDTMHDGKDIAGLSTFECVDEGNLCALTSLFGRGFYKNAGSVHGEGRVSLTAGTGSVPVSIPLFQFEFTLTYSPELLEHMEAQRKEMDPNENTIDQDSESTEVKEEL